MAYIFFFYYCATNSVPFIWTNLNPLYPTMFVPSLIEIGPVEADFYILLMYFCFFVIISPCKRVWSLICINLNSLYPRMNCVKFGWNWPSGSGGKIFEFRQCIFAILLSSPLWKRVGLFIEQTWIPFTQECIVSSLIKIGQVVNDNDNNDLQRTNFDQKSSLELSAQVS